MIVGVNEKLDRLMREYRDGDSRTDFNDVMDCVMESVACGDSWLVPAELMEDGMNGTDYEEARLFGELPMVKLTLTNAKDERYLVAFTNEESVSQPGCETPSITVKYSARALFNDLLASEEFAGIVLNPWTENYSISKENARLVLENAGKMSPESIRALQSVQLEPKAVLDTNALIAEWQAGWHDEEGKEENWKLKAYPLMADGRLLLLFTMDDSVYDEEGRISGRLTRCRVLEYSLAGEKPELLDRYKFRVQNANVCTVSLQDGVLKAVLSPDDDRERYSMVQMFPVDDSAQFTLYRDVQTVLTDSAGRTVAAYERNLHDRSRHPLMVFDGDGETVMQYTDEHALACLDANLDADENIWFCMYPSSSIEMLNEKTGRVESHRVALQMDRFALSTDRTKLFAHFAWSNGGSVQYVMTADADGNYGDPVRFDFRPEDAEGNVLEAADCRVFGRMSAMKSLVVLNADGRLYVYDVDDCCETVPEEGENGTGKE